MSSQDATQNQGKQSFGISEARKTNYTGPQGDFGHQSFASGNTFNNNYNNSSSSASGNQVDWNNIVDNVFKEETTKLAHGYQSGKY